MDPQLKQRLIGVTVIVALIVIFVPMFFDETDDAHPVKTLGGVPPIPDEVRESRLELPKSTDDVVPAAEEKDSDSSRAGTSSSGYTVIPLSDPEPVQKGTAAKSSAQKPRPPIEIAEEEPFDEAATVPAHPAPASSGKPGKTTGDSKGQGKSRTAAPAASAGSIVVMDDEPGGAPVTSAQNATTPASAGKSAAPQSKPANVVKPASKPKAVEEPSVQAAAPAVKPAVSAAPVVKSSTTAAPAVKSAAPAASAPALAPAVKPVVTAAPVPTPAVKSAVTVEKAPTPVEKPSAAKSGVPPKPVLDATVSTTPQAAAKPAVAGKADAVSAWVVQTGSFTTEVNAKSLVERLRQSKFAAFVEAVQSESGSVYRVQVGPELDRAHAEQLQKQIEGSVGIKGIVLPHR
ncbi:hypothetical protein F6R98_08025 [Candidatus Methylospira mobilis]|uniref:SPOR domain-containing protein n=1 Tax=Candidatus Methylospira mobilis TaxID=1808979 RepID=A0A5Q0BHH3_9GAMM|nr:SPOR domain-containing protein [Candidatus Methylospira mobilis]QFY42572.1 hypothetical protein F6R98_08025 [Candidatus Methylospira mobilis]WNV04314.1 SPOR domain-containing protein [Candidatus Methylospira mobilis]